MGLAAGAQPPWGEPGAGEKPMQYYDPDRDNPVDGAYMTAQLLALLSDLMGTDTNAALPELTPEGWAGLRELISMMKGCMHNVSRQLHDSDAWQTASALYEYLQAHPETEASLREFLREARQRGFTAWQNIPLD